MLDSSYGDIGVGPPVRRRHLVREPRGDGFGGARAVLGHRLNHDVHPVQDPLSRVLVVR